MSDLIKILKVHKPKTKYQVIEAIAQRWSPRYFSNELIPKNQELLSRDIDSNFKLLQSTILNETNKFLSSSLDKKTIEDFLNNINLNMSHAHNTLTTLISSSETRIETKLGVNDIKMNEMRTIFSDNNHSQKQLQNSVTEMMKKFEKGIGKGTVSEHITYNILYSLYYLIRHFFSGQFLAK